MVVGSVPAVGECTDDLSTGHSTTGAVGGGTRECKQPIVRADRLEALTLDEVVNVLSHPKAVMALAARQREEFGRRDDHMVRLEALNDQLSRIPEARSRLID